MSLRGGAADEAISSNEHQATMDRVFAVYILTNKHDRVLYTGVTNDLKRRIYEHREGLVAGFSRRYNLHKLVYFEIASDAYSAISREKQIKAGSRARKLALINAVNPDWRDLYDEL